VIEQLEQMEDTLSPHQLKLLNKLRT